MMSCCMDASALSLSPSPVIEDMCRMPSKVPLVRSKQMYRHIWSPSHTNHTVPNNENTPYWQATSSGPAIWTGTGCQSVNARTRQTFQTSSSGFLHDERRQFPKGEPGFRILKIRKANALAGHHHQWQEESEGSTEERDRGSSSPATNISKHLSIFRAGGAWQEKR